MSLKRGLRLDDGPLVVTPEPDPPTTLRIDGRVIPYVEIAIQSAARRRRSNFATPNRFIISTGEYMPANWPHYAEDKIVWDIVVTFDADAVAAVERHLGGAYTLLIAGETYDAVLDQIAVLPPGRTRWTWQA